MVHCTRVLYFWKKPYSYFSFFLFPPGGEGCTHWFTLFRNLIVFKWSRSSSFPVLSVLTGCTRRRRGGPLQEHRLRYPRGDTPAHPRECVAMVMASVYISVASTFLSTSMDSAILFVCVLSIYVRTLVIMTIAVMFFDNGLCQKIELELP